MSEHNTDAHGDQDHSDKEQEDNNDFDVTKFLDGAEKGGRILAEAHGSVKVLGGFYRWLLRRIDPRDLRDHLKAMDATDLQIRQHQVADLQLNNRKKAIAVKGAETKARNEARKAREAEHNERIKKLNDLVDLRFRRADARKEAEAARSQALDNDERENDIAHETWLGECRRALGDIAIGRISRNASLRDTLTQDEIDEIVEEGARRLFQTIEHEVERMNGRGAKVARVPLDRAIVRSIAEGRQVNGEVVRIK